MDEIKTPMCIIRLVTKVKEIINAFFAKLALPNRVDKTSIVLHKSILEQLELEIPC
ncbi:hypothetical protein OTSTA716_0046 [Orientia tsutsugamushi str. TA716]|uniref:Uncharacterized protein n=1 Tax=Orientia tsutsugamushi str. TA716 TaxID=1359175 RepID=A0A0F3PBQ2_ORITS|nr:hypothetical protein OTSTA716_0046 [Orientia tsutsugamushi str. TA716]